MPDALLIQAYCTCCKFKQPITNGEVVDRGATKKGIGFKGECSDCGRGLYKPLSGLEVKKLGLIN